MGSLLFKSYRQIQELNKICVQFALYSVICHSNFLCWYSACGLERLYE